MKRFVVFLSLCLCGFPAFGQRGTVELAATKKPSCCLSNVPAGGPFSDKSLWQLDSTWTNDSGNKVQLSSLRGRVQVLVMFFASCEYACPLLVHEMKQIEAALPETVREKTGFTLISFDPQRDTPSALRTYRQAQDLGTNRWTLLQGKPDDILELAALLGVKYKKDARGQFAHSNLITVLNEDGDIVYQQVGLNQKVELTLKAIERSATAKTPTLR
jgi:protein SCO1/2